MHRRLLKFYKPNKLVAFASRKLHKFNPPRPEVVIGNNSAIFATLATLSRNPFNIHPNLTFICPEFWLDTVHSDHQKLDWGQTILGLPRDVRTLFQMIYPNYPSDKLISWGEFQQLRLYAKDKLAALPNVRFIPGFPTITKEQHDYKISVEEFHNQVILNVPSNTYFYSWVRRFVKHKLDLPHRSHTELYKLSKEMLPKVAVVIGHGESMVWLARDFPSIKFINLKRPHDKLPLNPRYNLTSFERVTVANFPNDVEVSAITEPNSLADIKLVISKEPDVEYVSQLFTALGFEPISEITTNIPKNSKQELVDYSHRAWIAPQDMPRGVMLQSYMQWIESTNNLDWAYEPQAYHKEPFPQFLYNYMNNRGVKLDIEFFNKLEEHILSMPTMVDDSACVEIFVRVFEKVYNGNLIAVVRFREALRNMLDDKGFAEANRKIS